MALWRASWLLASGTAWACVTDHDALASRPRPTADAGIDSGTPQGGSGGDTPGSGGTAGRGPSIRRSDRVTLVHGVSDVERVVFCLSPTTGVARAEPRPPGGLAYGEHLVLDDSDVDFETQEIDVAVIGGDLAQIAAMDCAEAIAAANVMPSGGEGGAAGAAGAPPNAAAGQGGAGGAASSPPPALRAATLARVPAGTFFGGRSALVVAAGCLGGFQHEAGPDVCGADYRADAATLKPVIVSMSRELEFDRVGLQAVHATVDSSSVDVVVREVDGTTHTIATELGLASIAPSQPIFVSASKLQLGTVVDVRGSGTAVLLGSHGFSAVAQRAGLEQLSDANTYALVLIGPRFNQEAGPYWNGPSVTLVPTSD
jgi:hypothetical protein